MVKRYGSASKDGPPIENASTLHYIATNVDKLAVAAGLELYFPPMGKRQMWRRIYLSEGMKRWLSTELHEVTMFYPDDAIPAAQVEAELGEFCEGRPLQALLDVRNLTPRERGVWELKTPDVRLFGWFLHKDAMALHLGADANVLKDRDVNVQLPFKDSYKPYVDSVVEFRATLPGDTPCEMGMRMGDVLSNQIR